MQIFKEACFGTNIICKRTYKLALPYEKMLCKLFAINRGRPTFENWQRKLLYLYVTNWF